MKKELETGWIERTDGATREERLERQREMNRKITKFKQSEGKETEMPKDKKPFDEKVFMDFLKKKETNVEKIREALGVTVGNLERRVLKAFMKNKTLVYEIEFPERQKPTGKKNTDYSDLKAVIEEGKSFPEIRDHYGIEKSKSVSLRNKVNECCAKYGLTRPNDMTETRSGGEWKLGSKVLAIPKGAFPDTWEQGMKVKGIKSDDGTSLILSLAE